jgi:predicted TIM-barrel fold metal-dependent hydrolase
MTSANERAAGDAPVAEWLISVDDHVIEPPNVWQDRLPSKFKAIGPRLLTDDKGEAWFYEEKRIPTLGLSAAAGRKKEEFSPLPLSYSDMRPGCYDSVARLADMDQARILASLCFPSFPRLCGQTFYEGKDKELGELCVRAYNDFMIDEWCGNAPGRYIPLVIVPLWDPKLAAAEIRRCAGRGAKAISFSENPAPLGLPSLHHDRGRYWDPVFDAASECGLPLCTHFGSSSSLVKTSDETPMIATVAMNPTSLLLSTIDWLFSGILPRFPRLKICLSEGGLGWIPWVLQRSDYTLDRQRYWAASGELEGDMLSGVSMKDRSATQALDYSVPPSQLFRDHIFGCFIDEPDAVSLIEQIGVDNVMAETDYPHTDSSWPNSGDLISQQLAGLPGDDRYKVMRGNAERVFNFTPAPIPAALS